MQDNNEIGMLSVKELNKVINKLQNGEPVTPLGTFSEVDIVFVAGMFLWYMRHRDNWKRISVNFNLTDNNKNWTHSHYFRQIFDLYNVRHNEIFIDFLNANNEYANSFSRSFAPPVSITRKSIDCFFGGKTNSRIDIIKKKYIKHFDLSAFVNETFNSYRKDKQKFDDYNTDILQRLENSPAVFVFIFIISCERLVKKEKRTFEETEEYVERIWQFAGNYTNGLHELAKNIVEHGGQGDNDGQGMITIRAYGEEIVNNEEIANNEKIKVLETHVFDYGERGIYETLKQNTEKYMAGDEGGIYAEDFDILTNPGNKYTLSDFIEPVNNQKFLMQQLYREMAHYGLMNFKNLIEHYDGKIIASSVRKDNENKRERYIFPKNDITEEEINGYDITIGTSYYFDMLFNRKSFGKKKEISPELGNQQNVAALSSLRNFEVTDYADLKNLKKDGRKRYLVDIKILNFLNEPDGYEIDDRKKESYVCKIILEKLNSPNTANMENMYIALDFDGITLNESRLLRILARLSRERLPYFIVYNISCEEFVGLIEYNEQWFSRLKDKPGYIGEPEIDTAYWLKGKSILLFTRYDKQYETDGEKQDDYFYFADLLFGEKPADFFSINKIISNTFTNTTYISKSNTDAESDGNYSVPPELQPLFFYGDSNYFIPFDLLLKSRPKKTATGTEDTPKELFLFNIETILKNNLFNRGNIYSGGAIGIKNYVDNFDGYHISNTHFKIGNKVHSSDFFYAKRLFQNSFYTTRLAMHLAKKIYGANTGKNPVTLVGYEMYSELILSLIEKFLRDDFKREVNHFVAQSRDDGFEFLPKNIFDSYLDDYKNRETIIMVPIAATGNTTRKIETEIKKRINGHITEGNPEAAKKEEETGDKYNFFNPRYNIIMAQDSGGEFDYIKNKNDDQETIINLDAKWYHIKTCALCYGENTKPLFDTDNSSLTPSLIFGNPEGQTKTQKGLVESNVKFDDLHFEDSINYQNIVRNNNYKLFDIDSDIFIKKNESEIKDWLKKIVKPHLENKCGVNPTDKIIIVAPCHESNSQFINLINENVFSSAATIIHHQNGVDFRENFTILNKNYLTGENTKIFYVDDSLITGKHFFELFDLVSDVTGISEPLTASILLNDQAIPFIHNRAIQWSQKYFPFVTYNQPPTLTIHENRPLEHERRRYKSLRDSVFHDTMREHFNKKTEKLSPEKDKKGPEGNKSKEKQIRHLKLLEATHKIYDYFTREDGIPDLTNAEERKKFVDFKLKFKNENINNKEQDLILLKVLSQYPFILYMNLKNETFKWHKILLQNIIDSVIDGSVFNINGDYNAFTAFKFLLRRASFLGNNLVLEPVFLNKLLLWFKKIDGHFAQKEQPGKNAVPVKTAPVPETKNPADLFTVIEKKEKEEEEKKLAGKEENLRDFPVFVLGNYIEMIQENGWVANRLLKNAEGIDFKASNQGLQFICMLQIEAASVIDEFMKMIYKEYPSPWCGIWKTETGEKKVLDTGNTEKIKEYFKENEQELKKTNKYTVVTETFLNNSEIWDNSKFLNYLWIKQLLYADSAGANIVPPEIDYQDKIYAIIDKMKGFFPDKNNTQAFFIVTDGQEMPHVQYQEDNILSDFKKRYNHYKTPDEKPAKFPELITFLDGAGDTQGIARETTAEYLCDTGTWKNIYNKKDVIIDFLPSGTKWLYLIRISEFKKSKNGGKNDFTAQGLLGFYSNIDLSDDNLSKQLLMLLRENMGDFIKKHHKNDEFSKWVLEKEKTDSRFMRLHGTDIYKSAINYYKKIIDKKGEKTDIYINYLYLLDIWFAGRFGLLTLLDEEENLRDKYNYETFTVEKLINNIRENYRYILAFHNPKLLVFTNTDISEVDNFVELSCDGISDSDKKTEVTYLKTQKEQVIFELFYNIRKHVLKKYYDILKDNRLKVKIELKITENNNIKYLEISNNFCARGQNERDLNNKLRGNGQDGLSFIYNIFEKLNTGGEVHIKLENSKDECRENRFLLYIPITEGEQVTWKRENKKS